ncbi:Repeat-companion domain protein OS=Isosphaera pallida (strain ATCC 43644 / DSM 9630 / IS1B) GN=Isop_0537 PE=4 SV=1 [Gemmataceae bacterium]|nr:Repeat-companion domain protein OS=Isosphaera pallida (strain ATCC 43644 / DSM 9630 / IS1B) GN=Isop_0537 PE=4 SV=1 [Gemmataceae bacterium]VTT99706.1 Repeat-companion domain protein OS=Isosphaera pallida (strain ATCC 43644 / DSM 9630 / IS1B) GN=Isop_0537 PE=4 SV=1 [Gemmataceae bacterium]
MDLLAQHEAFLRAIFDAPDDDTPRLVYADFLQENGEDVRAELIRVQCELARLDDDCDPGRWAALEERNQWLSQAAVPWDEVPTGNGVTFNRGLWRESFAEGVAVTAEDLDNPLKFREWVVRVNPAWYGETKLYVRPSVRPLKHFGQGMWALPFLSQVSGWDLSGHTEIFEYPPENEYFQAFYAYHSGDLVINPVVTTSAVDSLVRHRGASRIATLDLRNNNLDNDAARALLRSPYLDNLQRVRLLEGNRLHGKVWRQLLERFGEDVVE